MCDNGNKWNIVADCTGYVGLTIVVILAHHHTVFAADIVPENRKGQAVLKAKGTEIIIYEPILDGGEMFFCRRVINDSAMSKAAGSICYCG